MILPILLTICLNPAARASDPGPPQSALVLLAKEIAMTNGGWTQAKHTPRVKVKSLILEIRPKITQSELRDALWIIERESGFRSTAKNPRSSAHGYGQLLNRTWRSVASRAGKRFLRNNERHQIEAFCLYVEHRYKTFARARQVKEKTGVY